MPASRDRAWIYAGALARSFGVGLTGVLLAIHLAKLGLDALWISVVVAVGLAGVAAGTLAVSLAADRAGRRAMLVGLSLLAAAGMAVVVVSDTLVVLAAGAFLGMVNGMGRDRGAGFSLDQAILPATTTDERRTAAFAAYNIVLDAGGGLGALAAMLPRFLEAQGLVAGVAASRWTLALVVAAGLASAVLYLGLSPAVEVAAPPEQRRLSPQSRGIVARLAALFALDSFGGGFLAGTLIAYWFFRRFGVEGEVLGPLFAGARVLNAFSYVAATWLAKRIGLVNTMVFTHIPSSLFLMAVPLAPSLAVAMVLYLLRECLVEMDVPTRQSYVTAVVRPEERTAASGITNLTRMGAWAASPSLAGLLMKHAAVSAPLVVGPAIKIAYDLLLWASFRRVKPPEEQAASGTSSGSAWWRWTCRRGSRT